MLLLGAYHGINPGMGWLFAVALGMQERKGSAVARALVPIALGHALAIGSVVLTAAFLGMALPLDGDPLSRRRDSVRSWNLFPGAALSPALGPHAGGLPRPDALVVSDGLGTWRGVDGGACAAGQQHGRSSRPNGRSPSHVCGRQPSSGVARHGGPHGRLSCSHGLIAWMVYRKFGLAVLRKSWLNLNMVWAAALVAAGLFTLFM